MTYGRQETSISIHFTDACNMRCPWCSGEDQGVTRPPIRLWSPEVRNRLFEHLGRKAYDHYIIHGGEPTLFPEELARVLHVIRTVRPADAPVSVFTNGTRLTPGLADLLNAYDARVVFSINMEGPKGLAAFFGNAVAPDTVLGSIRKLKKLAIRCVTPRQRPFALEAVMMHSLFEHSQIDTGLDITTLHAWTEDDIRHVDSELKLLHRLAPDHQRWHSMLLSTLKRCDCKLSNINYTTDGVFKMESHKTTNRTYGCAFAMEQMGNELYNRYISVVQTYCNSLKGVPSCPC